MTDIVFLARATYDLTQSKSKVIQGLTWITELPQDGLLLRMTETEFEFVRQAMIWAGCDFALIPEDPGVLMVEAEVTRTYGEQLARALPRLRVAMITNDNPRATEHDMMTLTLEDEFTLDGARQAYLAEHPQDNDHDDPGKWSVTLESLDEHATFLLERARDFHLNCDGYYAVFLVPQEETNLA